MGDRDTSPVRRIRDRWTKLTTLARIAPRRPREALDRIATVLEVRLDALRPAPSRYASLTPDGGERELAAALELGGHLDAFAGELRSIESEVQRRIDELPSTPPIALMHCAVPSLARAAYLVCRGRPPQVVIETGVAYGVTTRYILEALARNDGGTLESIDLPPLGDEQGRYVGTLVDPALRRRWRLHRGASRRVLPLLLARHPAIDVFVHDSLHTYRTMRWEFEAVWGHLRPGGVLLSDDIGDNAAFVDFVRAQRPRRWWAVKDEAAGGCFGVIVK